MSRGNSKADARQARFDALRILGFICCHQNDDLNLASTGMRVEIHHQNAGGHAGQKRLGDAHTVGLCEWHHRGIAKPQRWRAEMTRLYGPSLAGGSKPFRERYGSDSHQLALVDDVLRAAKLAVIFHQEAA